MDIVFCDISKEVKPENIYHFVVDGLKTFGVSINIPSIDRCEVIEIYDKHQRVFKYLGVVVFKDPNTGERAMRKLRARLFKGKFVRMREFFRGEGESTSGVERQGEDFAEVNCSPSLLSERCGSHVVTKKFSYSPAVAA